jgi:hypothetical protein
MGGLICPTIPALAAVSRIGNKRGVSLKENAEGTYKTKHAEAARLTYTNEFVQRERFRAENEREC